MTEPNMITPLNILATYMKMTGSEPENVNQEELISLMRIPNDQLLILESQIKEECLVTIHKVTERFIKNYLLTINSPLTVNWEARDVNSTHMQ